jgi:hypothetical protein
MRASRLAGIPGPVSAMRNATHDARGRSSTPTTTSPACVYLSAFVTRFEEDYLELPRIGLDDGARLRISHRSVTPACGVIQSRPARFRNETLGGAPAASSTRSVPDSRRSDLEHAVDQVEQARRGGRMRPPSGA